MKRLLLFSIFCVLLSTTYSWAQVYVQKSEETVQVGNNQYFVHTVRKGQTVYSIAKAYGVKPDDIYSRNPFARQGIETKQTLLIPEMADSNGSKTIEEPKKTPLLKEEVQHTKVESKEPPITIDKETRSEVDSTASTEPLKQDALLAPFNRKRLDIALLLPFKTGDGGNENFAALYRGLLIGLESLKSQGISAKLRVLSSVNKIDTASLRGVSLIIGPVYEQNSDYIVKFATENRIAMVSPLSEFKTLSSPYIYQAAPDKESKYSKLQSFVNSNTLANIITIEPTRGDKDLEMDEAITKMTHNRLVTRVDYSKATSANDISTLLSRTSNNIIIVPANRESEVEQILSRISSLNTTGKYNITVVGASSWGKFSNINLELYFKLSVRYISSYHADRSSEKVRKFYSDYMTSFSSLPNLFSFRGYDMAIFFGTALEEYGTDMPLRVSEHKPQMLDVNYNFKQEGWGETYKNQEWMMVKYNPNFTIEVE